MYELPDPPGRKYVNNRADHASLRVNSTAESKSNELSDSSYGVVEVIVMKNRNICSIFSIYKSLKLF